MTLRTRIAAVASLSVALAVLAAAIGLYVAVRSDLRGEIDHALHSARSAFAGPITRAPAGRASGAADAVRSPVRSPAAAPAASGRRRGRWTGSASRPRSSRPRSARPRATSSSSRPTGTVVRARRAGLLADEDRRHGERDRAIAAARQRGSASPTGASTARSCACSPSDRRPAARCSSRAPSPRSNTSSAGCC